MLTSFKVEFPVYSDGARATMWNLIPRSSLPPTRQMRYCCEVLKEQGGKNRFKITGVRASESYKRKQNSGLVKFLSRPRHVEKEAEKNGVNVERRGKAVVLNYDDDAARRLTEHCYRTSTTLINPIIDWSESDVWEFLHHYGCESNPLYACGSKRVGCVGCPMASMKSRIAMFRDYPKYKKMYVHAFDRMLQERKKSGKASDWSDGYEVFQWWMGEDIGQLSFFDAEERGAIYG